MRSSLLRPALAAATLVAGFSFAAPAHAETVAIGVTVTDQLGATAYATSDKVPTETFTVTSVRRVAVTDVAGVTVDNGKTDVGDIHGVVNGHATYVVTAHPGGATDESFDFQAVVDCVRTAATGVVCAPSLGLHTVITVVTGPFDQ